MLVFCFFPHFAAQEICSGVISSVELMIYGIMVPRSHNPEVVGSGAWISIIRKGQKNTYITTQAMQNIITIEVLSATPEKGFSLDELVFRTKELF